MTNGSYFNLKNNDGTDLAVSDELYNAVKREASRTSNANKRKSRASPRIKPSEKTSHSFNILGIVVFILLFATVASILVHDGEPKTFGSLLEMLTTVPDVSIPWQSIEITNLALPDWLSWAVPVLNFLEMLITVGAFLVNGIWQAIKLAFWVIKWLFA